MIFDAIRDQIDGGRTAVTEFVSDAAAFEKIVAAVCGFLNTKGGVVFVGVTEVGDIAGVGRAPEKARRDLEARLQKAISPKALFTLSVDEADGESFITVEAPQGRDPPYVVEGRAYVRRGRSTRPADGAELRAMVQDKSVQADRWERRPSLGLELDDLDKAEIRETVQEGKRTARLTVTAQRDTWKVLSELGLATSSGLTQGCDVLFGQHPARRHPQVRLRYIQFATDKAGDTYLDNRWIEGPLAKVFDQTVERLGAQVRIQAMFREGEVARDEQANYSLDALREGLVNALAHRDYASFSGGVSVSIFPSRIEIWNTGRLPSQIKLKDLEVNHPSIPINPDICHVLYLRNLMERTGRGTLKIISGCLALGAKPPLWADKPTGVTLTLFAAEPGRREVALNERQFALLETLRPGDTIRHADYLERVPGDLSERQVRRDLAELEGYGLLERVGQARATAYRRTDQPL